MQDENIEIKSCDLRVRKPGNSIQLCLGFTVGGLGMTGSLLPDLSYTEIGLPHL